MSALYCFNPLQRNAFLPVENAKRDFPSILSKFCASFVGSESVNKQCEIMMNYHDKIIKTEKELRAFRVYDIELKIIFDDLIAAEKEVQLKHLGMFLELKFERF